MPLRIFLKTMDDEQTIRLTGRHAEIAMAIDGCSEVDGRTHISPECRIRSEIEYWADYHIKMLQKCKTEAARYLDKNGK